MSTATLPAGTYVPVVTPFTDDDAIDFAALDDQLERLTAAGVDALVMLGTTGESPTVSEQESAAILEHTLARIAGRAVVLAGLGTNDTAATCRQAHTAASLGVDGLLVVCPYYSKPSQAGLRAHYEAVADAADSPLLAYNIAGRTGVNIKTDTLLLLGEHPNIVGVKESSDDINQVGEVLAGAAADFLVLSGCDHLNYPLMCLGGHGAISTLANLVPNEIKSLVDAMLTGDYEHARKLHFQLLPLARGCFVETNPIPLKTALSMMGIIRERFRLPIAPMQPENRQQWCRVLEDFGLLEAAADGEFHADRGDTAGPVVA